MKSMRSLLLKSTYNPILYSRCGIEGKKQIKKDPVEAKEKAKWDNKSKSSSQDITQQAFKQEFLSRKVVDYVWIAKEYPPQVYSAEEAIKFHMDLAQEPMLNNMNGFISAKLILDMSTRKKGKFMESVRGLVKYPYQFDDGLKKEVIAICRKEDEIKAAKDAGALYAGSNEILKMFDIGEITDASYDYIVCTNETLPDLLALKKKIRKDRLPSAKSSNVGDNIAELVELFRLSKAFESAKISDETGLVKINFGIVSTSTHSNTRQILI
jgi:ribosomal protein L1